MAMKNDRVFIPTGARLCDNHFTTQSWSKLFEGKATMHQWNRQQIEAMVDLLREEKVKVITDYDRDFFGKDIGLDRENFYELLNALPSLEASVKSARKAEKCLQMYLMRLRKGVNYEDIGKYFNLTAPTVSVLIKKARNALTTDFVPCHLGFENLGRDFLKQHTTEMAQILYCNGNTDSIITIWDGTYIYTTKSKNFGFQKETYSGQKHRNLVKPMLCVCPDGYIVDIFGAYKATMNDATIMKDILETNNEMATVLRPFDVFVVDRGFRDVQETLKKRNYIVQIPKFIDRKTPNAQLTTEQANLSRLVTKCRWVVESRNAHLKTIWAIFEGVWNAREVLHLNDDIRIAAALINKYSKNLISDKENAANVANTMLQRVGKSNEDLKQITDSRTFQTQKKHFEIIDMNGFTFPVLNEKDLKMISLGSYQPNNARSYAVEHIKSSARSIYECFLCPLQQTQRFFKTLIDEKNISEPIFVLTQMKSRFRNGVIYDSYIFADAGKEGPDSIISYCCDCVNGLRTIGSCSHVITTLYYLCHFRHEGGPKPVAPYLNNLFD